MKRHDLYKRGRGCSTTCLSFGKDRKVEFPDYFFCHGCDLLEGAVENGAKRANCQQKKYACTAGHSDSGHPTTLKKLYRPSVAPAGQAAASSPDILLPATPTGSNTSLSHQRSDMALCNPLTKCPLLLHEPDSLVQSRNLCFPLRIVIAEDCKKTLDRFRPLYMKFRSGEIAAALNDDSSFEMRLKKAASTMTMVRMMTLSNERAFKRTS
jgi:hypothetical protein